MSVNDCYICCNPLNSGTIYTIHPKGKKAEDEHQIHKNCLIQLRDLVFLEDPLATNFACGLCRERVSFPATMQPSAQRIINWLNTIHNTITTGLSLIGLIGFIAGPLILNRLLSNKISKLPYPTIVNISLRLLPPLIIGIIDRLFRYNSLASSWIRTTVTTFYNRKYKTELLPRDIIVYDCAMTYSFETQLSLIGKHCILLGIASLGNLITKFFFDAKKQKIFKPLSDLLNKLQKDTSLQLEFEKAWISHLQSAHPELIAKLKNIKMLVLSSQGNSELKKDLAVNAYNFLVSGCIFYDINLVIQISLIFSLHLFAKNPPKKLNLLKKQEWIFLFNSFKDEIQNPNGQLLSELRNILEENLKPPFSLPELTTWNQITTNIFLSLLIVRKKTLEERDFLRLSEEIQEEPMNNIN